MSEERMQRRQHSSPKWKVLTVYRILYSYIHLETKPTYMYVASYPGLNSPQPLSSVEKNRGVIARAKSWGGKAWVRG